MKKREIIEGVIKDYDFPNKGSFELDGKKVIVKGALPGQKVSCMVSKVRKDKAEARLLDVLERSEIEDAVPPCPQFGICGGCAYQTMSYEHQLELKAGQVKKLLDGVIDSEAHPYDWEGIIGSPVTTAYRNKMEYSFGDEYKDGPLVLGLHKKNSMYDIVPVCNCVIVSEDYNRIVSYTMEFARAHGLSYHKKMQHVGLLRHLVLRQSKTNGGLLVNLVTSTDGLENLDLNAYVEGLLALPLDGTIVGILHTANDSLADAVVPEKVTLLYGRDYIEEEVLGLHFQISPFSFFQTNTKSAERLYSKAREYAGANL